MTEFSFKLILLLLILFAVVVTGVTLLNSAFWTFHPVYCRDVHIHHMEIQVPWLAHVDGQAISGFNGDGIDIDSSQDVLIEHNYINCGDDHFTILSGVGDAGKAWSKVGSGHRSYMIPRRTGVHASSTSLTN